MPDAASRGISPRPPGNSPQVGLAGGSEAAVLLLTQPPPAKGLYASARSPAEAAALIKIRVVLSRATTRIYPRICLMTTHPGPEFAHLATRGWGPLLTPNTPSMWIRGPAFIALQEGTADTTAGIFLYSAQ